MVELLDRDEIPHGTFHLASAPITKDELIRGISTALSLGLKVASVATPTIDRTLDSSALEARVGLKVPSWSQMLDELAHDASHYSFRSDLAGWD
jgi:hypothetical protein